METPTIATRQLDQSVWLVELAGEHDLGSVADLRAALEPIFDRGTCIILDLSATTFIDSSMLGEVVRAERHADSRPGEELVVVVPPGTASARMFELTSMHELVAVCETREAALARFEASDAAGSGE